MNRQMLRNLLMGGAGTSAGAKAGWEKRKAKQGVQVKHNKKHVKIPMDLNANRIENLRRTYNNNFDMIDKRIEEDEEKLEDFMGVVDRTYARQEQRFNKIEDEYLQHLQDIKMINERLNDCEMAIKEMHRAGGISSEEFEAAIMQLKAINEQTITSQRLDVDKIHNELSQVENTIQEILNEHRADKQFREEFGNKVSNLEAKYAIIDELRDKLHSIMEMKYDEKLAALDHKLMVMEQDPLVKKTDLDRITFDINTEIRKLNDEFAKYQHDTNAIINRHQLGIENLKMSKKRIPNLEE